MPKHPTTRAERRAIRARAIARAVRQIKAAGIPDDARTAGIRARTPAPCSCHLCRPAPYKRTPLACVVASELETY